MPRDERRAEVRVYAPDHMQLRTAGGRARDLLAHIEQEGPGPARLEDANAEQPRARRQPAGRAAARARPLKSAPSASTSTGGVLVTPCQRQKPVSSLRLASETAHTRSKRASNFMYPGCRATLCGHVVKGCFSGIASWKIAASRHGRATRGNRKSPAVPPRKRVRR